MKRVGAWILLAGFVLLLANLMVFHFYMVESFAVYLIIAIWFIFNNKPLPSRKKKAAKQDENNHTDNNYYVVNDLNNDSQDSAGTETDCGDCDSGCDCGDCGDCGSSDSGSND
jgi:hypothetical protein